MLGTEPSKKSKMSYILPSPALGAISYKIKMAPALGLEPRTKWLTATYSTIELRRSIISFNITSIFHIVKS